jgi:signal transduction histidine kinase
MNKPLRFVWQRTMTRRFQPLYLVWPLLLLAMIIGWLVYLDYRDTERELRRLLAENANTLLDACATTILANESAFSGLQRELARRLVGNARTLARLETTESLSPEFLRSFAAMNGLSRIHLLDAAGNPDPAGVTPGAPEVPAGWQATFMPLFEGQLSEMVVGAPESRYGSAATVVAAVTRRKGGILVVAVRGELLEQYRREMGLGQVLHELAVHESVVYVMVQDEDGPISVSPPADSIVAIDADPFLQESLTGTGARTRFIRHGDREILEAARAVLIEPEYTALLRLGLNLDFYHQNLSDLAQRDLALGLAFFLGGGLLLGLAYTAQNYRFLHSRYIRSLQMAGHITENMQEAMLLLRTDGTVAGLNQRARNLFDVQEDDSLDPALRQELRAAGIYPTTDEERGGYLQWQGKTLLCRIQFLPATPLEPSRDWLFLFLDVTAQHLAEEKLRREERLAALGRLISGVAHEIRNPLNALALSVQTMQRRLRDSGNPRTLNSIAIVQEEITRLDRLVEDFLTYARPVEPHPIPLSLRSLVERARELFSAEMEEKQIRLVISPDAADSWPQVRADEQRLFQVLVNIFRNSLDAMETSGTLQVGLDAGPDQYRLTVRDSGSGFTDVALRRAAEPFFTTKSKGTGLGLSLSEDILRRHGWILEYGNGPSGGAEITITIPGRIDHDPELPNSDR